MSDIEPTQKPLLEASPVDPVTPDELMSDFRGHSLVKILLFTVVVHVFILAILSPGYIKEQVFGESEEPEVEVAKLTDDERLEKAQKDGKQALREVADKYGLTMKELREQLDAEPAAANTDSPAGQNPATPETADPGSAIEKELDIEVEGPKVPDLSVDEEEDLFAPESP